MKLIPQRVPEEERRGRLLARVLTRSWRPLPPEVRLSREELAEVASLLLATGGAALGWRQLRRTHLGSAPPSRSLRQAQRLYALSAALQERDIEQVFTLLRSRGVEPLLVKGWAVARLYPEPGLRPGGDIDVVVPPRQFAAADAALREPNTRQTPVELHAGYPKLADRTMEELIAGSQLVRLGDAPVRIPGPEDHLRLLALHMLAHGAWRPLWLCDIGMLIEARPECFDWERCLRGRQPYSDWMACVIGLAHQLLGASLDGVPLGTRTGRLPRWLSPAVLRQWGMACGASTHAPLAQVLRSGLKHPAALLAEARLHWRNPVQATVEVRGPFNELPRLPFQVAATLLRALNLSRGESHAG